MLTPSEALEPVLRAAIPEGPGTFEIADVALRAAVVALVVAELEAIGCCRGGPLCSDAEIPTGEACTRCQRLAAWRAM